jgi:hypothetical protein
MASIFFIAFPFDRVLAPPRAGRRRGASRSHAITGAQEKCLIYQAFVWKIGSSSAIGNYNLLTVCAFRSKNMQVSEFCCRGTALFAAVATSSRLILR